MSPLTPSCLDQVMSAVSNISFLFSEHAVKMPVSVEVVHGSVNWLEIKKKDTNVVVVLIQIVTKIDRDSRKKIRSCLSGIDRP